MQAPARASAETAPPRQAGASVGFAACLILLLFVFLGLLGYGRTWLALPLRPDMTVYLALMIGLTVGIWVLTWCFMLLTGRARDEGERM